MADEQDRKIIVDDDWKSAARAEKEKLKQKEAEKQARQPAPGGGEGGEGGEDQPLSFDDMTRMLAMQALTYMGAFPDPQTGRAMVSMEVAKLHIDLLEILREKTEGNLTEEEKQNLEGTLHELRMQFVEVAKAVEKARAEGRLQNVQQGQGGVAPGQAPMPGQPPAGGPGGPGGMPNLRMSPDENQ